MTTAPLAFAPATATIDTGSSAATRTVDQALPSVSVIIVNANGVHHLRRCLPSLVEQHYAHCEVLVIDNASTDGSVDYVISEFPWIRVVKSETNLGYAGGNNLGFQYCTGEYIAVLNPDTQVEPGWLEALVRALLADPSAGLATPKILLMDDHDRINACGNEITYTGLTFCRGLGQPASAYDQLEVVSAVSGAAFVVKRSLLEKIGGFDDDFFMYFEDSDLSLRAMLAGYSCVYVPDSIIYHQYTFRFSPSKCYFQERNRYFSLLKTYHWRTLLALMPSLMLSEIITWGYVVLQGPDHIRSKLRSYAWLLGNRRRILEARRRVQAIRQVDDHLLLNRLSHRLTFAQTSHPAVAFALEKLLNPPLALLGWVSRGIVSR